MPHQTDHRYNTIIEATEAAVFHINDVFRITFPRAYSLGEVEMSNHSTIKLKMNLTPSERIDFYVMLENIKQDVPNLVFIFKALRGNC